MFGINAKWDYAELNVPNQRRKIRGILFMCLATFLIRLDYFWERNFSVNTLNTASKKAEQDELLEVTSDI